MKITTAVALYVTHYNRCRVHKALRITPAMQLGIGELLVAELDGVTPEPVGRKVGPFRVIDGEA